MALALPWLELVVGLYLLAGLFTRVAAWGAVAMLAVFMAAITQALLRGLSLEDCGCFGDITSAVPALQYVLGGSTLGAADVLRDAVYAALALLVALGPATPLSIDGLLAAQRSASAGAAAGAESRPERALERRKEPDALRHRRRAGHEADPGEDQHQQQHHAEVGEQGQQRSRGALLALAPRLCLPCGPGRRCARHRGPLLITKVGQPERRLRPGLTLSRPRRLTDGAGPAMIAFPAPGAHSPVRSKRLLPGHDQAQKRAEGPLPSRPEGAFVAGARGGSRTVTNGL